MFQFAVGDHNVLELLLQPVLSLPDLLVFLHIMHELHLTDGPLTVGPVKSHSSVQLWTIIHYIHHPLLLLIILHVLLGELTSEV